MSEEKKLNGNQIKMIAIIAMTIDHIAWVCYPSFDTTWYVYLMHIIGRLTAPIMWFFIAEGCHYTKNPKKYIQRMFLFALISHSAFNFAMNKSLIPFKRGMLNQTSVMWPLAWAVVLIMIYKQEKIPKWLKVVAAVEICLLTISADWSFIAVMCPFFMYIHRGNFKRQMLDIPIWASIHAIFYILFRDRAYGVLQMFTCLSIPVLMFYNGKRGNWKGMKWFFYIYYPVHLVIMGIIRVILHGATPLI